MHGRIFLIAALMALAPATTGLAKEKVTSAETFENFNEKFCRASRRHGHIFVVPLSALQGHTSLSCDFGEFTLRMTESSGDPGHVVINIDPPASATNGLDCDAKADTGMQRVALNCLPADQTSGHGKS